MMLYTQQELLSDDELWAPVDGFPDYCASSLGRLFNMHTGRYLNPNPNSDGYVSVSLYKDKKRSTKEMGRIIAASFHGPPPSRFYEADHIDGVRNNNRASNLRWSTKKENIARRDLSNTARGTDIGIAKLDEDKVRDIRRQYASGSYTQTVLGQMFGVDQSIISDIVTRKTWRHVD